MRSVTERSTGYAIPAPAVTTVAVAGTNAVFPVARVFCVGRNYAEHSIEMGGDPEREAPFFFMKPGRRGRARGHPAVPHADARAPPRGRARRRAR